MVLTLPPVDHVALTILLSLLPYNRKAPMFHSPKEKKIDSIGLALRIIPKIHKIEKGVFIPYISKKLINIPNNFISYIYGVFA